MRQRMTGKGNEMRVEEFSIRSQRREERKGEERKGENSQERVCASKWMQGAELKMKKWTRKEVGLVVMKSLLHFDLINKSREKREGRE